MANQHTIAYSVSAQGKGLHSNKQVNMCLKPAEANTGIAFERVDLPGNPRLTLAVDQIKQEPLCTALVTDKGRVATIEHLLAALAAAAIDNIVIALDADEVPIMDGSAAPFVFLLQAAGQLSQKAHRRVLVVKKTVTVADNGNKVQLSPADNLELEVNFHFDHPVVAASRSHIATTFASDCFIKEYARARTFGRAQDLEFMHQQGLALGAGLDNAIGLGRNEVLNAEGLRFADEFIRHKLLDAVGDLYVCGPIQGRFCSYNPSHALNNKLLRQLLADDSAYCWQ